MPSRDDFGDGQDQAPARLFAAFVRDDGWNDPFEVYLVNNTDQRYPRVALYMGGFAGTEEGVIETSRATTEFELPAHSAWLVDEAEAWALDFTSWYHLDLYAEGEDSPEKVWFLVPKGATGLGPRAALPTLVREGRIIELKPRTPSARVEEEIDVARREGWQPG